MSSEHLKVPYLARLDNLFQPGQSLVIRGIPNGKKFDLNLTTGPRVERYEEDDVALHLSWRFNEKCIVFNSMERREWQKEERHKVSNSRDSQPFDIRIRAHDSHYEIYLDHKKFTDFRHRVPLNTVNYVFVQGDLILQTLAWEGNYYSMPYRGGIPGHFGPGRRLFVTGVTDGDAKSFHINLHAGTDIAFRLTANFADKVLIRNSREGGQWGREEKDGKMPIQRKQQFDMAFYCELDGIQVSVDNKRFCVFKHRVLSDNIDVLTIEGDLQLQALALEPNLLQNHT